MTTAGAPSEIIKQYKAQQAQEQLEIHPLNWSAIKWFLEVCDQWKWRSDGQCLGLDWLAVEAEARLRGATVNHNDFKKLKIIANEACFLINKKR